MKSTNNSILSRLVRSFPLCPRPQAGSQSVSSSCSFYSCSFSFFSCSCFVCAAISKYSNAKTVSELETTIKSCQTFNNLLTITKKARIICRDRVIPIIEPCRPAVATIETPIMVEHSTAHTEYEDETECESPLPPPRKNSMRELCKSNTSSAAPILDEIIIEDSSANSRNSAGFKRVIISRVFFAF